jgi:sulfoxide reductase heme-binding subunit YedZ
MIAAVVTTRALWYVARGTGVVSLVLLTAIVALGIASCTGIGASRVPRYATVLLHRNLSLLVVAFLVLHVATSVLDPFAAISWTDAVVPLRAGYRPVWLGLGAVACDLLIALVITSLVRARLGLRTWRSIHWLAYACWPVALVHGLGTGSDVRSRWLQWTVAGSLAIVLAAAGLRLARTPALATRWCLAGSIVLLAAPVLLVLWLEAGPLRPGWARHAGTPARILRRAAPPAPDPG